MWNAKSRKLEFTLGSHTASVNVVRWGGEGVIYTASSDRTVKLWDGKDVSGSFDKLLSSNTKPAIRQGKLIRTLSDHAHWVNTAALNTDFILRTGPYDQTAKAPADEAEGSFLVLLAPSRALANYGHDHVQVKQSLSLDTRSLRRFNLNY